MLHAIQIISILLVALAMAPALAHALAAVLGMLGMQIGFWLFTQPVNKFWLQSTTPGSFGAAFFNAGARDPQDWKVMRGRWERSHIARTGLAAISFLLLVVAVVTQA